MKKAFSFLILLLPAFALAQSVGIGTSSPDASALLQLESTSKGLLIPRMTNLQMKAIANPAKGLLVFNSTDSSLYIRRDSGWVNINSILDIGGWSLHGNANIDTAENFIGTTDQNPVIIKVNNRKAGLVEDTLSPAKGNIALGLAALATNTTGFRNTAIGSGSMELSTSAVKNTAVGYGSLKKANGTGNVAIGDSAMLAGTSGDFNTAVGDHSLYLNNGGDLNVAIGTTALVNNTIGEKNTAIGASSLALNNTGVGNVAVGYRSLYSTVFNNHNVAIGDSALFSLSVAGSHNNVGIGYKTFYGSILGRNNVAIGDSAGYGSNGANNIFIGHTAAFPAAPSANNILFIDNRMGTNTTAFIFGDMDARDLRINANTFLNGFTKLGSDNSPYIKIKKLTINLPITQGATSFINHGLTQSKILSITALATIAGGYEIPAGFLQPGFEYTVNADNDRIAVNTVAGQSASILGATVKVLITYEE